MSGVRRLGACLVSILLMAGAVSQAQAQAAASPARVIDKINDVRRSHGLPALRRSGSLNATSSRYATRLIATDSFGHASRIQANVRFSRVGEVLALRSGWRSGVAAVVRGWLRSPSHRSVVLSRTFAYIGAGIAQGRFLRRRATIWVVQVGAR